VVGSVFGLLGLSQKSDLDAVCPERVCPPSQHDELDTYETRSTISSVGLIAGSVLAVTGAALVLTAPSATQARGGHSSRRLALRIGFERVLLVGELP